MSKPKRKRCPHCGFLETIKWGKQNNHQRYKCKNCDSLFTHTRKDISKQNRFVWFERWILHKQTIEELSESSGYSEKSLRIWFEDYLRNYPKWEISRRNKVNLVLDGTYFKNKVCLVAYRDFHLKSTLLYRLSDGEWEQELREDLENIISMGITIESVTSDGLSNIIKSVKKTSKNITLQRCLVHITRECKIWLTKHPKRDSAKYLRQLVCHICQIKSYDDRDYWLFLFDKWQEVYHEDITQKSYNQESGNSWYTHKMLRKSFVHIKRALPNMFMYLDNPNIPNNTNSIESFFGHLKKNISIHRGLSKIHYQNYVKWYLYFRNLKRKRKRGKRGKKRFS